MPNTAWPGSRAALGKVTHYKPQAEVHAVGVMICSPLWRQSTLTSKGGVLPHPAHQGLFAPIRGRAGGHAAAYTHSAPVYSLLVEAAARGGRVRGCTLA